MVAHIEQDIARLKLCDPNELLLLGVALHEAITNAMLHGNLELVLSLREKDEKAYYRLGVERRDRELVHRRVYITTRFTPQRVSLRDPRDEGNGFYPGTLPNPTDPANLDKISGRGLLLIQTFMDRVAV
jgi:anti-sigma regulatory factor (Ser/Thr protein kinase)